MAVDDEPRKPDGASSTFVGTINPPDGPRNDLTSELAQLRADREAAEAEARRRRREREHRGQARTRAPAPKKKRPPQRPGPGRRKGSEVAIPFDTFWWMFERIANEGASARAIDRWTVKGQQRTDAGERVAYVNKTKAGVLVSWVHEHRRAARTALRDKKIPAYFLVTSDGVLLLKSQRSKRT